VVSQLATDTCLGTTNAASSKSHKTPQKARDGKGRGKRTRGGGKGKKISCPLDSLEGGKNVKKKSAIPQGETKREQEKRGGGSQLGVKKWAKGEFKGQVELRFPWSQKNKMKRGENNDRQRRPQKKKRRARNHVKNGKADAKNIVGKKKKGINGTQKAKRPSAVCTHKKTWLGLKRGDQQGDHVSTTTGREGRSKKTPLGMFTKQAKNSQNQEGIHKTNVTEAQIAIKAKNLRITVKIFGRRGLWTQHGPGGDPGRREGKNKDRLGEPEPITKAPAQALGRANGLTNMERVKKQKTKQTISKIARRSKSITMGHMRTRAKRKRRVCGTTIGHLLKKKTNMERVKEWRAGRRREVIPQI